MTAIKSQLGRFILISCMALLSGRETLCASDDQLIAGAKKEGEVSLYLSTNLTDANGMMQSFKQKYPFVNVGLFRADNEKLLSRILTEASAGKFTADVVLISSFEVRVLIQKKLLQKYLSPESRFYPEGFTDKDGYWTSVYSIPRVMAYNTKLVRPDAAPKTYDDLLQPKWKGNVGLSDSAVLWYAGFLKFYGDEKGREYMKKLAAQKPAFRDSETVISQLLAAGEFPLGAHLFPPDRKPEKERRAGGLDSHHATHRNRPKADLAQQQGDASERGEAVYRFCSVQGRSRADSQFQSPSRSRRCAFGAQGRRSVVSRRPSLGR